MRIDAFRRPLRVFGAALTIILVTRAAGAQVFGQGDPLPGGGDGAATIELDVTDRPIADVLKHIRERSGANILLAPGAESATVTIAFSGVPWREALELVAENAGCVVVESKGRVFKVEKPAPVSFEFEDEEIRKVILAIAKQAGANVIIAPDVTGLVTMKLEDRPWRDALDNVVKTLGYHVVEEERGVLRVVSTEALIEQLETRVLELKYLRPKSTYVAKITTDFAVGEPKAPANDPNVDFPLLAALRKHLSKSGELDYFADQNAIFLKDVKPVLDKIEDVVARLDVEPAEIFIDVKFVTTQEGDNLDLAFGVEQLTATWNGAAIPSKVPFNFGPGGFDDHVFPGGKGSEGPILSSSTVDDLVLKTGLLDFRNIRLAVRLNEDLSHVEVVQAPKLITLDHQEATVFVGDIIRYAETTAATNQAGGLAFSVSEAQNSPVETGFQLLIIPHVVPGTNKVMMTVIPQARFLSGTSDPNLQGFNIFGVEGAQISLPQVTSQTVVTNLMLESGQTGVIGGLITNRKSKLVSKVPLLGDIPIIGFLFRRTQENETNSNLLVFITPTIIHGSQQSEEDLARLLDLHNQRSEEEWDALIEGALESMDGEGESEGE